MKQAAIRKFSSINSPPLNAEAKNDGRKKSVPGPTSPMHFFSLLMFSVFQRPLSVQPITKAGVYLCSATAGSLIFGFVRMPSSYFSNRYNLLNLIFVKWGWAWTCLTLSIFVILSSFIYSAGNTKLMRAHILRIVTGTGFWYTITGFMELVIQWSGSCYHQQSGSPLVLPKKAGNHNSIVLCKRSGGAWYGFDISGHCFLLSMANLWILEELNIMQYWSKLSEILQPYDGRSDAELVLSDGRLRGLTVDQLKSMRSAFRRLTGPVRWSFSVTACLSVLWDLMFVNTIIYFHTMPSKMLGTIFGVGSWFLAYRVIFPSQRTGNLFGLSPGLPGDGLVNFVPRR